MSGQRSQFSSRLGFILAAAGSAVGLGNIWGYPTSVASNGGAAFVLVYFILAFFLAYPVLMVELTIGRYTNATVFSALDKIATSKSSKIIGLGFGYYAVCTGILVLCFYSIVASWMMAYMIEPIALSIGGDEASTWITTPGLSRNIIFAALFLSATATVVLRGIEHGIEKFSKLMMPLLLTMLIGLIIYTFTLEGAMEGLHAYLLPDFSQIFSTDLLLSALGQAFFSLSLGVGGMLLYGSYISKSENLPQVAGIVTFIDCGIAFIAGLLILPALYVAKHNGTQIYDDGGNLFAGPDLIFQVLPNLFNTIENGGSVIAFLFFMLMSIAALTSSIAMLELPTSAMMEKFNWTRKKSTITNVILVFALSCIVIFNFDFLFGKVIHFTTEFSMPLVSIAFCIFLGWLMNRKSLLEELKQGNPEIEHSFFWKWWPTYVKFICPVLIFLLFLQNIF